MKVAFLVVVALASAGLVAGCDTQYGQRTTTVKTPSVQKLRPTKMEREWRRELGLAQSTPAATGARAEKVAGSIRRAAQIPGVQVVSLKTYSTPSLAPALVLAVARPAYFLRHQLEPVIQLLTASQSGTASYLRIVDERAKRVLEWYGTPSGGSLYVRPGLERCSPIVALGWPFGLPPCPSK